MLKIYISFSRQDLQIAKEVSEMLTQHGYGIFVDDAPLSVGDSYVRQIISQLKSADLVVFIVSESSLNSQWCQREIDYARSLSKRILPISLSEKVLFDSDFYRSRLASLQIFIWDAETKKEFLRLLRSQFDKPSYCPSDSEYRPNVTAMPVSSPVKSRSSGKSRLRKYGFSIAVVLFVVLLVGYALYPVGSSTPHEDMVEPPYMEVPYIDDDYTYSDGSVAYDTVACVDPEIVVPSISDDPYESDTLDIVAAMIPEGEYTDTVVSVPPVDNDKLPEHDNDIIIKLKQIQSSKDDVSSPLWMLGIIIVVVGVGVFLLYVKRKLRVKVVSNMDCLLFIDNKQVAALKAKTVAFISLRKGQYYFVFKPLNDKIKDRNISTSVTRNDELISMEFQVRPENDVKTIRCFIAGSTKLEAARNALRAGIAQTHNKWRGRNFEILSYTYEDFEKMAVDGGHQNKYDEFIENEATLAVFIISGEIGQYTVNEFKKAINAFKQSRHPQVLVFNDRNAPSHEQSEELKKKVADNNQYWSNYDSFNDLKQQFMYTLDWMLIEMFL